MSSNPLVPKYYNVSITKIGSDAEGFIDHVLVQNYETPPSTFALSLSKERANMRYEAMLREVSENISPLFVLDQDNGGATVSAPGTAFSCTLAYDRPEYLYTDDETDPGTTLTGTDALTRQIARCLIRDIVQTRQVYDPTNVDGITAGNEEYMEIVTASTIATGGNLAALITNAESAITVTEV